MKEHLEEEVLHEYLDGVLDVESRRAVETHLSVCRACRAYLQDLQRLFTALAGMKTEDLGRDLTPPVLNRLPARRPSLGWRLALAVQAGVALGILIAALQALARIAAPSLQLLLTFPSLWKRLSGISVASLLGLWEMVSQPCSWLQDIRIPWPVISYRPQILPSLPVAIFLLIIIPALWWIGSIHLLPDGAEDPKPL